MLRRRNEHALQVACVRWFRLQFPRLPIFAIPNGGARDVVTGARLKAEGVTAGVPDLCIPVPSGRWHSLYIELKDGKSSRPSAWQKVMIAQLRSFGHYVAVCHSFVETVKGYISETL